MSDKGYTLVKYILELLLVFLMVGFIIVSIGTAFMGLGSQYDEIKTSVQDKLQRNNSKHK